MPVSLSDLSNAERLALKETLSERQNHRCCWCGERLEGNIPDAAAPTFEHVTPRSEGGKDAIQNLAIACLACNQQRGSMPANAYYAWVLACKSPHGTRPAPHLDRQAREMQTWYLRNCIKPRKSPIDARVPHLQWLREYAGLPRLHELAWVATYRELLYSLDNKVAFVDPLSPDAGLWPEEALERAAEAQNHRCCFCTSRIAAIPMRAIIIEGWGAQALRNPAAIAASCVTCASALRNERPLAYAERLIGLAGSDNGRAIHRLRGLEAWLHETFNNGARTRIKLEFSDHVVDSTYEGRKPKAWADFLADLKDACMEYGIAA